MFLIRVPYLTFMLKINDDKTPLQFFYCIKSKIIIVDTISNFKHYIISFVINKKTFKKNNTRRGGCCGGLLTLWCRYYSSGVKEEKNKKEKEKSNESCQILPICKVAVFRVFMESKNKI
jgi:hypothetical protein